MRIIRQPELYLKKIVFKKTFLRIKAARFYLLDNAWRVLASWDFERSDEQRITDTKRPCSEHVKIKLK